MKNTTQLIPKSTFSQLTVLTLATLVGLSAATAKPKARKLAKKGHGDRAMAHAAGDAMALGAAKDKFMAHKRSTAGGAGFYSDANAKIRGTHIAIYKAITNGLIEDRLSDKDGRAFVDRLFAIGAAAGGEDLSEQEAEGFRVRLQKLTEDVREARADKVNQNATTPRINRLQVIQEEVIRFGVDTGELSDGQVSSLRRKMDSVESKEQAAKEDGEVDDRERENALEASRGIWEDIIRVLRP